MEKQIESINNKEMKAKKIYGIEISEFELFCIRMICDYLFLDRFNDSASFVRFEHCFGPLFNLKEPKFSLVDVFKSIVGKNKKYLTFRRMIKAYINWKKKAIDNFSFNYFMNEVFNNMIIKKGEVIGQLIEGERIFSTRNCNNRKIITKLSVLTDESKNIIKGFIIEYDDYFKAVLCIKEKQEEINLQIHFNLFHSKEEELGHKLELDRDGITHIAGKYEENSGIIKFLIFKCRSGKTMYIGDSTEKEGEKISPFIFGSSKCQLKTMCIGLIQEKLAYLQPKYQISTRINENLNINFEELTEEYLENDPPKFEEREYANIPPEQIGNTEEEQKKFLYPLIMDNQFVDKMNLIEEIRGKDFNEIYKSYFEEEKPLDKFKEMMKKKLQDDLSKENREEKIKNEKNNLLENINYRKNNFESVFVKLIKYRKKMKDLVQKEEDEEIAEDEDDIEDDLNVVKIKSGEYLVKEQQAQKEPILRANKVKENKEKEIKQEPLDNNKKSNVNYSYRDKKDNTYNNHKMVEIKYTSKKNNK